MLIKTALCLLSLTSAWHSTSGQIMAVNNEDEHNLVYQILVPPKDYRVI